MASLMLTIIRPTETKDGGWHQTRAPWIASPTSTPSSNTHHFSFNKFPYLPMRA